MKKFVPVMLTPFKENGDVDYEVLGVLVEFYLSAGAEGLFANCLSSEMYQLSELEILTMVRFIVDKVNNRVPVVATGTLQKETQEQIDFIKKVHQTGVSAVILITSLLAEEQDLDTVFLNNTYEIIEKTKGIPLGFYECPQPYKRIIKPEILGELVNTGRIKYHKDTCLNIETVQEKIKACETQKEFGLYDAYMVNAVKSLNAGATGLSCIQGNYFPELVVWLCKHYSEDTPELKIVQDFFIRNMDLMHHSYPASAKYVLRQRGLPISQKCRNGSEIKEDVTYQKLKNLLKEFDELSKLLHLKLAV